MPQSKLLSTLNLCLRARQLVFGFDEAAAALQSGSAKLLALARDLSPKSAKEIIRLADRQNIDTVRLAATMEELWGALGKRTGILVVTQEGLAGKVRALSACPNEEERSV